VPFEHRQLVPRMWQRAPAVPVWLADQSSGWQSLGTVLPDGAVHLCPLLASAPTMARQRAIASSVKRDCAQFCGRARLGERWSRRSLLFSIRAKDCLLRLHATARTSVLAATSPGVRLPRIGTLNYGVVRNQPAARTRIARTTTITVIMLNLRSSGRLPCPSPPAPCWALW
jgi:hypothetical protein